MYPSRLFPLFLALLLSGFSPLKAEPLDLAIRQFQTSYLSGAGQGLTAVPTPEGDASARRLRALKFADSQKEDGSWPDIDYANQARSNWRPYEHVQRLVQLAVQLSGNGFDETGRERLRAACIRGCAFWRSRDFKCPNWWYNEIGVPQMLGTYALLMGGQLPKQDLDYIGGTVLERCGLRMTGQNKVWLAGNVVMQGMLGRDEAKVAAGAEAIWSEISITEKEGIQPDWSFHQHGPQLQFGNYGLAFAGEEARWIRVLAGTPWELPPEKIEIFRNYLLRGLAWVCWRDLMDLGSCGRQIFPNAQRTKARAVRRILGEMPEVDRSAAADYAAVLAQGENGTGATLAGNRWFWRSDYMIQRTSDFFGSLRLSSSRVLGAETVNSENLRGRYLADGVLIPLLKGDEYSDIYPVWDWRHLPGTTLAWKNEAPATGRGDDRLLSRWVGGASDGTEGCAALAYERDGVKASKAWFFSGSSVVCLGAGIEGGERLPVHTTLNQCLRRGPIMAAFPDGDASPATLGTKTYPARSSLEHDGLLYRFYQPALVTVESRESAGNWNRIYRNPGTPAEDLTKDVFSLWIDHGTKPSNASYAYGICPASSRSESAEVLENNANLQAVRWRDDTWQAILWTPGSVELAPGLTFRSDQPCVMMAKRTAGTWVLSIADPSHRLSQLSVAFGSATRLLTLPDGIHAGSTLNTSW